MLVVEAMAQYSRDMALEDASGYFHAYGYPPKDDEDIAKHVLRVGSRLELSDNPDDRNAVKRAIRAIGQKSTGATYGIRDLPEDREFTSRLQAAEARRREYAESISPGPDYDWRDSALCAQIDNTIHDDPSRRKMAEQICTICDVRKECLADALHVEDGDEASPWTMRGGLTRKQRDEMRRQSDHAA